MANVRTIGFGTGEGVEGVVVSPDVLKEMENPAGAAAEYLRDIRDRYCLPGGMYVNPFNLLTSGNVKIDCTQTTYNAFLLTVTTGVAQVFFGDFTGGGVGAQPHFTLSAAIAPVSQTVPFPPGQYIFTVQADTSGACSGCFTPMAL